MQLAHGLVPVQIPQLATVSRMPPVRRRTRPERLAIAIGIMLGYGVRNVG